jgi:Mrp family chromosome partitioning ATPase
VDVLDYLRIIRRRWRLVAAVVTVAALVAIVTVPDKPAPVTGRNAGPVITGYKATTTLLRATANPGDLPLATLPVFVRTGAVPKAAADAVGYTGDPNILGSQVVAQPSDGLGTLEITVKGQDGDLAAKTADAFATALIDFLRERANKTAKTQIASLRDQLDLNRQQRTEVTGSDATADAQREGLDAAYTGIQNAITTLQVQSATAGFGLQVLQPASPVPLFKEDDTSASALTGGGSRSPLQHVLLLIGFGLVLGLGLTLVVERFDSRLHGRSRFEASTRLPVVTGVPLLPRRLRNRHEIVSVSSPHGAVAESFRSLRSALLLLPSRPVPQEPIGELPVLETDELPPAVLNPAVVLATSARAGEGKTTTLVNLACALAESGRKVIVLDCDFRHPEAHQFLGVPGGRGLSDLLAANQGRPLESVMQPTVIPNVQLVTAGSSTEHPGALLGAMGPYVREAKALADVVLIDAPPVLLANDAIDVMPFVDTVIVIAKEGATTVAEASRVAELLSRLRVACLGVVMIGASDAGASYFGQEEVLLRRRWRRSKDSKAPQATVDADGTIIAGGKRNAGKRKAR